MLHVERKAWWYSLSEYRVYDESGLVGEIRVGSRFTPSVITVDDEGYLGRIAGWARHHYLMESGDVVVAHAQSPAFRSDCVFKHSGAQYTLRYPRWWGSTVDLVKEDTVVGSLAGSGFLWSSGIVADLPNDLPVQIRFFIIWLRLYSKKFEGGH